MNAIACPYCQGNTSPRFHVKDLNRKISDKSFIYRECDSCEIIFLQNIPDDLGAYYPLDYYHIPADATELAKGAEPEQYKIDIVRKFKSKGALIEIGPALGSFSYLARQAGFDVTAIEMNHRCCVFLRNVVGVNVIETANELAALSESADADVIVLWHVIEHLTKPWELIQTAARKLKPGGILVIAAPNPNAFQFRLLKSRWTHVDAPRHVMLLPVDFIKRVAAENGLEIRMNTTCDEGSLGWNEFGWRFSLMSFFSGRYSRKIARFIGRLITKVLHPLESRDGMGSAYTIVLQKVGQ